MTKVPAEAEADQDGRGVKPAANYFQRTITQEVLPGLVYSCCEVYIDDVLVYDRNEDEYIGNLRLVFQRFREKESNYQLRQVYLRGG
jgi:hypothetical protein